MTFFGIQEITLGPLPNNNVDLSMYVGTPLVLQVPLYPLWGTFRQRVGLVSVLTVDTGAIFCHFLSRLEVSGGQGSIN